MCTNCWTRVEDSEDGTSRFIHTPENHINLAPCPVCGADLENDDHYWMGLDPCPVALEERQ